MSILTFIDLLLQAKSPSPLPQFLLIIGIFIIMYFFMIRPQTKKANEQKNFIGELKQGDKVVTIGGVHGKIVKVNEDSFLIEVAQNTRLKIEKSVISLDFTRNAGGATKDATDKSNA